MSDLGLDLFAGIGGWEVAARRVCPGTVSLGVDGPRPDDKASHAYGRHLLATRAANGLLTVAHDVRLVDGRAFAGIRRLKGSPPCQPFTLANGNALGLEDPRGRLMHDALRIALEARPETVTFENVKGTAWLFEEMAAELRAAGYAAEVRVVNAADYGLPQARLRALLVARRDGLPVAWPAPTHYGDVRLSRAEQEQRAADLGLKPWVTLAEALPDRTDLPRWAHERPAVTVVGSFQPEVLAAPGWRKPGDRPRQHTPGSVTCTVRERLLIQGFPSSWRLEGPATAQGLMAGNAIPPVLAEVALTAATSAVQLERAA